VISRRDMLRGSMGALLTAAAGCDRTARTVGAPLPGRLIDSGSDLGHRLRDRNLPPTSITRRAQVVVAGAGISGLAAAYALRRHGIDDVLLLDPLAEIGGNASYGENGVSAYPWGAHYVPLVRPDCEPVLELFRDLKIIVGEDARGRPVYDEYCLSADPQERLWVLGRWQEGLVPEIEATPADRREFGEFFRETERLKQTVGADGRSWFAIPVDASSTDADCRALDGITMSAYLQQKGWRSPLLAWYVNYCCRDDYGSTADAVSAWAGLHYFAARNGAAANADPTTVVTWPEGNGHLVAALAARAAAAVQCRALVTRIAPTPSGAVVEYFDAALQRAVRVEAAAAVGCLPRFVAERVVENLAPVASQFSYAPWMVANLTLSRLPAGRGQQLAWDNVIFDSPLLGYVVATHQKLSLVQRATVITYYWPLSHAEPGAARHEALARSLEDWQHIILGDLLRVHPELEGHIENIDVRIWGHAMVRPTPGFIWGEARRSAALDRPPIFLAHSDLSGISIFEEAYCRGFEAGTRAAQHALTHRGIAA
jgi:phytoene dehydrogenase-like protein